MLSQKLQKELEAQKKRADALKHLDQQGQNIKTTKAQQNIETGNANKRGTDNTLDLLLRRGIVATGSFGKDAEKAAKESLLRQQSGLIRRETADAFSDGDSWKEIVDQATGKTYFWNLTTNETAWEKPASTKIVFSSTFADAQIETTDFLPAPWIKKTHPGTQQTYYFNSETKKSSFDHPISKNTAKISELVQAPTSESKKRTAEEIAIENATKKSKRASISASIDPLDPTGGKGKNGMGLAKDGKMADSTASGPLWQQRPYPAPGKILRKAENQTSNIGPSFK